MTREQLCSKIQEALDAFQFKGEYKSHKPYGTGHINDTFRVICTENGKDIKYILQRINHEVFHDVPQLMENIVGTTEFLGETIIRDTGHLSFLPAFWRAFEAASTIERTVSIADSSSGSR